MRKIILDYLRRRVGRGIELLFGIEFLRWVGTRVQLPIRIPVGGMTSGKECV